jgi:hypothetical protein
MSCGERTYPTVTGTPKELVFCDVEFRPAEDGIPSRLNFEASFAGDPVPSILNFMWLDRPVPRTIDKGIPGFADFISPAEYHKEIGVSFKINAAEKELGLTIPDSFSVLKPETAFEYISPWEPYEVVWSKSADADYYRLNLTVLPGSSPEITPYVDSMFLAIDTTFTVPNIWIRPDWIITIQIEANIGFIDASSAKSNYNDANMIGFLRSSYQLPAFELGVAAER